VHAGRRRALIVVVSVVAAIGLLYVGARETPVFALQTFEVTGAPPPVRAAVLREVDDLRGDSLVALDGGTLVRRLESLPSVRSVTYDRAFPHTLRLVVIPERPVAVVHRAGSAWVVAESGRVISPVVAGEAPPLPRIRYPLETPLVPGSVVPDAPTRTVLAALAEAPGRKALPIRSGVLEDGELTFLLDGDGGTKPLLMLGPASEASVKLRVAALVLRHLSVDERASLAYLDVSLPDRPVTSDTPLEPDGPPPTDKSQVSTTG
jgi:cell division protein FtsQ